MNVYFVSTFENVTTIDVVAIKKRRRRVCAEKMLRATVLVGAIAAATAFSPALPSSGRKFLPI